MEPRASLRRCAGVLSLIAVAVAAAVQVAVGVAVWFADVSELGEDDWAAEPGTRPERGMEQPRIASFIQSMKWLGQRDRPQRPTSLLEWHRWFAWYPWLQNVERKWGTSRYSGTIKWRYRLPTRSRGRLTSRV